MPTTSQILGLTPHEKSAAIFTALGEAGPGRDPLGVLQTVLARKFKTGGNVAQIVKAPNQFVANNPYKLEQITDPAYGQKVYGSRYKQVEQMLEDPMQMAQGFQVGQGATQFRGQALLQNKQKGDIMFDPKGNFYFQTNPGLAKTLSERLKKGISSVGKSQAQVQQQPTPENDTYVVLSSENATDPADFLSGFVNDKFGIATSPQINTGINPIEELTKIAFATPKYFDTELYS
jgi:hypothetical protein